MYRSNLMYKREWSNWEQKFAWKPRILVINDSPRIVWLRKYYVRSRIFGLNNNFFTADMQYAINWLDIIAAGPL